MLAFILSTAIASSPVQAPVNVSAQPFQGVTALAGDGNGESNSFTDARDRKGDSQGSTSQDSNQPGN
jgi:hypothetical protein